MALVSPGVQVTIIDQSQYLPAASNSVPLILLATAQNKADPTGKAVAVASTAANANKLYQVTSQRDLVTLFGNPFFYKTSNGTSIHGYELNEYGLLAAYSLLGTTNRAYILRADIDLASLVGSLSRPSGSPADGTYWLDTTNTTWGIYEFDAGSGKFSNIVPNIYQNAGDLTGNGAPLARLGNIGDYAVTPNYNSNDPLGQSTYWKKSPLNTWVKLGTEEWQQTIYTVLGSNSTPSPAITANSDQFTIQITTGAITTPTFTIAPTQATVDNIVTQIKSFGIPQLDAANVNGKLGIKFSSNGTTLTNTSITLADSNGTTLLEKLGITAGTYYAPELVYGSSAEMPLWSSSQQYPHPTGSVWIKTSQAGNGLNLVVSSYNATTSAWVSENVSPYQSLTSADMDLDPTGGKNIPAGTVIAGINSTSYIPRPITLFERLTTGPTVVTGSITTNILNGSIPSGTITVDVSQPGEDAQVRYTFTTGGTLNQFILDWTHANIGYTAIAQTSDGALQISHTLGGEVYIADYNNNGQSAGIIAAIGLTPGLASNSLHWRPYGYVATGVSSSSTTSVHGTGSLVLNIGTPTTKYTITGFVNTSTINYETGDILTFSGALIGGATPANDLQVIVTAVDGFGKITGFAYYAGAPRINYWTQLSNWTKLSYIANEGAPAALPVDGTNWYYSSATDVDIMVNVNGVWKGYGNVAFDNSGHPRHGGSTGQTDPNGIILSATAPSTQSDGSTALVYGDLWLDTSDLENYPIIHRWELVNGYATWVLIDNTDQTSSTGILFADARWGKNVEVDPVNDPIPTIGGTSGLWGSDYLDLDAPNPTLYPQGMLLFNTRRSGYNIKQFRTNYFTAKKYPNSLNLLPAADMSYTWVTVSGLKADGSAYMGRKAQRNLVVESLKATIGTNLTIREEDNFFNLIACPGYPELQPDMVTLNNDRNNTAYIVGDTPLRLPDQATEIQNWATNVSGATESGEDGWVTRDEYLGVFYPSGITSDLTGAQVVVPASHMILRTMLRNDTVAYPWLAAAGTRRGTIDNATNIGYLNASTGEFTTVKNRMSLRDVLYTNQINPMTYFTGIGLLNYGNKNSYASQSAMDRTNVARLVAYIRYQLQIAARPFVFEPNDALTRSQLAGVVQSLFVDLVAKRGLYDYLVVCDESNNTPARIDRNELWVDVAIEPVKAAEFIYIPVRIVNTGALAAA